MVIVTVHSFSYPLGAMALTFTVLSSLALAVTVHDAPVAALRVTSSGESHSQRMYSALAVAGERSLTLRVKFSPDFKVLLCTDREKDSTGALFVTVTVHFASTSTSPAAAALCLTVITAVPSTPSFDRMSPSLNSMQSSPLTIHSAHLYEASSGSMVYVSLAVRFSEPSLRRGIEVSLRFILLILFTVTESSALCASKSPALAVMEYVPASDATTNHCLFSES